MRSSANTALGARSWEQIVREQIGSLRFGVVQVVVHEGRVVQIERTEKVRLDARPSRDAECETDLAHQTPGGGNP